MTKGHIHGMNAQKGSSLSLEMRIKPFILSRVKGLITFGI